MPGRAIPEFARNLLQSTGFGGDARASYRKLRHFSSSLSQVTHFPPDVRTPPNSSLSTASVESSRERVIREGASETLLRLTAIFRCTNALRWQAVIVPDANLLLYAFDSASPFHESAASWWQDC